MSEQEWNFLPGSEKKEEEDAPPSKEKLLEVKEAIAKGDEMYVMLAKKFLNNIELAGEIEDPDLTREVMGDLFQTATRAIGLISVMEHMMKHGPKETFAFMAAAIDALVKSSKVVGLMDEFQEFLKAKRAKEAAGEDAEEK